MNSSMVKISMLGKSCVPQTKGLEGRLNKTMGKLLQCPGQPGEYWYTGDKGYSCLKKYYQNLILT